MELDESWGRAACSLPAGSHECGVCGTGCKVSPRPGGESNPLGSLGVGLGENQSGRGVRGRGMRKSIPHRYQGCPGEVPGMPGQRSTAELGRRGGWWGKAPISQDGGGSLIFVGHSSETPREPERLCFSSSRNDIATSHYFLAPPRQGRRWGVTSREVSDFDRQGEPCSCGGEDGKRLFHAGHAGFAVARGEICSTGAAGERQGARGRTRTHGGGLCAMHGDALEPDFTRRMETFPPAQVRSSILDKLGGFNE